MLPRKARLLLATALAGAVMLSPAAPAETLQDVLSLAYDTNPTLAAARAQVRAQDEQFIQARSNALPRVTASVSAGSSDSERSGPGSGTRIDPETGLPIGQAPNATDSFQYGVSASQNIFRGGRTGAAMDQALANIYAARAQLASTEQQVLLAAVQAYMDVRRDEEILAIRANNVEVLERQLQASRDRFEVGEITRTDVSLDEANLADARSQYSQAQAQLTASRAAYEQIIGQPPGTLEPPPPLPELPADLEQAFALAMESNPDIAAAAYSEESARAAVRNAKGAMYPTVSLSASAGRSEQYVGGPLEFAGDPFAADSTQIGAQVSIPLFSGNALSSQLRQARQGESSARFQLRDTERRVRQSVSQAWSAYLAAVSQTESTAEQVRAAELAFEGVQAEQAVGLRTTLDVLIANQQLLAARLNQVSAERNAYVAGYALLQAIGRVNPQYLRLDVDAYDPSENLEDIRSPMRYLGIGVLE